MIGLDTNILLRAATQDDPVQSPIARQFIAALTPARPGYVNMVVLAEFVWSLGKKYRYGREKIMAAVEALLSSPNFVVAERNTVNAALIQMQREPIAFADALIGVLNQSAEAAPTMTFDIDAHASSLFKSIEK